ncbi:hypothetical protein ACIFOE_20130 [Paenibacillus sp. NRS-1783]|uniref:hypothetical protein n=1 Tax=Paenibacillus sp. NRS-1783 TaxID=3233907 RepID=UPI003D274428
MKMQKMLKVKWSESEQDNFYVDRNKYSKAHDSGNTVLLRSYSGVYEFDKTTKSVTLHTGVAVKDIKVVSWEFYEAPSNNFITA